MSTAVAGLATASSAVDFVAADLSFTLAFQIALELLAASRDSDLTDDTLVAYVIALGILINVIPRTLQGANGSFELALSCNTPPLFTDLRPLSRARSKM